MEQQKKNFKLARYNTRQCALVHNQSSDAENRYESSKLVRFKTSKLQSDICNYSDAYIVDRGGTITVTDPNNDAYDKKLAFKNTSTFISCISKIYNTLIDNAEDLDIVMPMYNFLERSKNYSKTTENL